MQYQFNNAQREILKVFSYDLKESELEYLKDTLKDFFNKKL